MKHTSLIHSYDYLAYSKKERKCRKSNFEVFLQIIASEEYSCLQLCDCSQQTSVDTHLAQHGCGVQ